MSRYHQAFGLLRQATPKPWLIITIPHFVNVTMLDGIRVYRVR